MGGVAMAASLCFHPHSLFSRPLHSKSSPKLSRFHGLALREAPAFLPTYYSLCTPCYCFVGFSRVEKFAPCVAHMGAAGFATSTGVQTSDNPRVLVNELLSLVQGTDRGALLSEDEHLKVSDAVFKLERYCLPEPLLCPLIFGEWDVEYCSNPTSPGGYYRSAVGRVLLRTKEMIQTLTAPDLVVNRVVFAAFGVIDGEVSLKGSFKALDNKWIQITFDPPNLKLGPLELQYGRPSTVRISVVYLDEKIRLGIGSRGSIFIFRRHTYPNSVF
eukprot:c20164_g1_i1 orf=177-992(+)